MAAQSRKVAVTGSGVVLAFACTYRGLTITSAAGATVTVYDNASAASGDVLASFTLAAGGMQHVDIADGVRCDNGVYVNASAAITGHVRVG